MEFSAVPDGLLFFFFLISSGAVFRLRNTHSALEQIVSDHPPAAARASLLRSLSTKAWGMASGGVWRLGGGGGRAPFVVNFLSF